jgi:hypothetical protein
MVLLIGVKKVELDKEIQMSNKPKKDIWSKKSYFSVVASLRFANEYDKMMIQQWKFHLVNFKHDDVQVVL